MLELAAEIIAEPTPYRRVRRAAIATLSSLHGARGGAFSLARPERSWLSRLSAAADELPDDEEEFIAATLRGLDLSKVRLDQYGLRAPK